MSESLIIRLLSVNQVYSWAAFLGQQKTKHMLFIMFTPRTAVAIPRYAFESKTADLTFCNFVERQITGT